MTESLSAGRPRAHHPRRLEERILSPKNIEPYRIVSYPFEDVLNSSSRSLSLRKNTERGNPTVVPLASLVKLLGTCPHADHSLVMSPILDSLERMLDVYREKCITQSKEIERLKQAMEDTLIASVRGGPSPASATSTATARAPPAGTTAAPTAVTTPAIHVSRAYIDELADELDAVLMKNEQLERDVARLQRRLGVEEEWRAAAMEFMEIDARIHKIVNVEGGSLTSSPTKSSSFRKKTGRRHGGSSIGKALRDALAKTRCLEKSLRAAL